MGYKKLFWGFVFLFDFRINGFDVLPDFIGYILFYQGLAMLEDRNEYFNKAKSFALPMILISIFDIFQVTVPINQIGSSTFGLFSIVIGIIVSVINLLMVYNICLGIATEARVIGNLDLESKAISRWKLYFFTNVIILLSILLVSLLGVLFFVIIIISIISYILMLGLMNLASEKLE